MASVFGLLVGDQILMWLAVAGVAALLQSLPALFAVLQGLGAAYLAWMGWRMLRTQAGSGPVLTMQPHHYFRQALIITLLNPKAILFYLSFFLQFVDPAYPHQALTFLALGVILQFFSVLYLTALILVGARLAAAFLQCGLVDAVRWYTAPLLLGAGAPAVADLGTNGASATAAATLAIAASNATGTSPFSAHLSQPATALASPVAETGPDLRVRVGLTASANGVAVSQGTSTTGSHMRDLMRALATVGSLSSTQADDPELAGLVADIRDSLGGAIDAMATDVGALGDIEAELEGEIEAEAERLLTLVRESDATGDPRTLCLVDELLSGTNAVERLAASTACSTASPTGSTFADIPIGR